MAPPRPNDRPARRRGRILTLSPREDLEVRIVPSTPGVGSVPAPTAIVAPLETMSPGGGSESPGGYTPQQIRTAYGFDQISFGSVAGDGAGQTIAIIDAYDDPDLVSSTASTFSTSDLAEFDRQFGLPDPPSFAKLNEQGNASPLPGTDPTTPSGTSGTWESEEAMDVEWAHALAPDASIVLIEARSANMSDLNDAITTAAHLPGVSVVSMSWGGSEYAGETQEDASFQTPAGHQGITFVASSGDAGSPGIDPAYSPDVVAVGGTQLQLDGDGDIQNETAWSGSGGGTSSIETEPSYQEGVQTTGYRTIPDVAFDASNASGVAVYDSYDNTGGGPWVTMYGTSLGAPSWSALVAVADQGRVAAGGATLAGATQTLPALYSLPSSDFHDITGGSNGDESAGPGYDEVTGLGSPVANLVAPDLAYYGMADRLAIASEPGSSVTAGESFGMTVDVDNPDGTLDTSASGSLTIAVASGAGGLGGTLTATIVDGIATFRGLSIDEAGSGYSLSVSGTGFTPVGSSTFAVTPAAVSQLAVASQPPSSVQAGAGFGLTVDIEDAYGNLVTTATNSVTLSLSGSTLGGTLTVAATGGMATFSGLSMNRAGSGDTIDASAGGLTSATADPVAVVPAAPARIVIDAAPSSVVAGSGFGLTASVEDAYGNLETSDNSDLIVSLASGPAGASLDGTTTAAIVDGVATFSGLELTRAASGFSLTVSETGVSPSTSGGLTSATSGAFAVIPAAAAMLVVEAAPPSSLAAGQSFGLSIAVEDAYGNVVTTDAGEIGIGLAGGPSGAVLDGTTSEPVANGVATFSGLELTAAGSGYAIEAAGDGLTSDPSSPMTVTAAAPAQLAIVQQPPSSIAAGSAFGLSVAVEDAFGNLDSTSDADVSLGLTGGAGLGGSTTAAAVDGVATFQGLTIDASGSSYQLQASSPGLTGVTTTLGVASSSATQLVISVEPPASVSAGNGFGLAVSVDDGFGNPVIGYSGPVTVSVVQATNGAVVSGATTVQAAGGSATFSGLTIDQAGDDMLEVSAAGVGTLPTIPLQVVPSAPSRLAITDAPPGQISAGQAFGVTAEVEDAFGNVESGFNGTITAGLASNPAGGSLSGPTGVAAVNGVADISGLAIDRAGSGYAVGLTVPGLATVETAPITVVPSAPTRLVITLQPPDSVKAGRPFAVGVEALDAFGNVATGFDATVTASLRSGAGALEGDLSETATGGQAVISDAMLKKAGSSYAITITSGGLTPAVTSVFSVTKSAAGGSRTAAHRLTRAHLADHPVTSERRHPGHTQARRHAADRHRR